MRRKFVVALAILTLVMPGLILFSGCSSTKPPVATKAAIIDQLYVLTPNQPLIEKITAALENYGFKVDYYRGDQITVDFYRQLPPLGYRLIIFRAHSGLLGTSGKAIQKTCLFTNEPYSETEHIAEQLSDQLAKARIDENYPWVFGIGADFVSRSMQEKFDRTVLIMMGCSTLYINDLAQSFIEKGASSFIGWDATVGLTYTDSFMSVLLDKLLTNSISLETAIVGTMHEKGADPDYHASLKYYPQKSGNRTFSELMQLTK